MSQRPSLEWDDVRYVLALARNKTLSAASKTLGVSHTTVSRRIRALESGLGSKVFEQHSEGYALTSTGEAIMAVAERVEAEMLSLDRDLVGRDSRMVGALRFATLDMIVDWFAADIAAFVKRFPDIDLSITTGVERVNLTRRDADVALRVTNNPPDHLVGRRVGRIEFALYAARPLRESMPPDARLSDYPWLAWDERLGARMTNRWMKEHVPDARIALRVDSLVTMVRSMRSGLGISFLSCYEGDRHADLVRLRPPEEGFGMDLWLLTHPDLRRTARVAELMKHLAEAVSAQRDALAGVLVPASRTSKQVPTASSAATAVEPPPVEKQL